MQEIPVCAQVKSLGRRVVLVEEFNFERSPDATIDDEIFEIKRISKASNIENAIGWQFRTTYKKSDRILLHIDQTGELKTIRNAFFRAVKRYPNIIAIWVSYQNELHFFDRSTILAGQHFLKNTKGEPGGGSP